MRRSKRVERTNGKRCARVAVWLYRPVLSILSFPKTVSADTRSL